MSLRRTIALAIGAMVTLATFVALLAYIVHVVVVPEIDRLIVVSVALGPAAMISVMVGYGAWWMALFLLTLFSSEESRQDAP